MKRTFLRAGFGALIIAASFSLTACDREGPAERTGKSLDNAGERVKDAIDPPGPAQKVGRALDNATKD